MIDPEFAETDQIDQRADELHSFLTEMFDEDDRPWFVSNEATVYDIFFGEDADFLDRCRHVYDVRITAADLRKPVWQLLDRLGTPKN